MKDYSLPPIGKAHFIGIAGSAIAPIAIMMRKKGWEVSGSDTNVFEPALSLLNENGIDWAEGYDETRVVDADVIILGGAPLMANPDNPEYVKATELGKPIVGYAAALREYVVKDNSIVITGSYGKTTISAMVTKILDHAGVNPSYMMGGKPLDYKAGVRSTDSDYSVMEGDEFVSVFGFDMEPRFVYYKPKYAVLTATKWDHLNVYPTEESYINAFYKLADIVNEREGELILCAAGENNEKIVERYQGTPITYMLEGSTNRLDTEPEYIGKNIQFTDEWTSFDIYHSGELLGTFKTVMFGMYNVENALVAVIASYEAGIPLDKIQEGLAQFAGVARRQQIIGNTMKGAIVMDDFAHSPMKITAVLEAVKEKYADKHVIALYLPRMSERADRTVLKWYPEAFAKADTVIIPRITVKKSVAKENRVRGKDLVDAIKTKNPNAHYIPKNEGIRQYLKDNADDNTIIIFMSGGGWGGLMEDALAV